MDERKNERGQALVETILVLPVLLLLMVGVVEVGSALRDYLAVVNTAREGARFAARGYYLNDAEIDYIFDRVISASGVVGDKPFLRTEGTDENAEIIITYVEVISSVTGTFNGHVWRTPDPGEETSRVSADQVMADHSAFESEIQEARVDAGYDPTTNEVVVVEIFFEHDLLLGGLYSGVYELADPGSSDVMSPTLQMYSRSEMRVILDREGG